MANSEQTKRALADGLRLALKKREYGDITVADITDCSGMSRNTFYYHFRDKEELVDWVFQTDLKPVIRAAEKSANWTELLGMVLDVAEKNREFYAEVLTSQGYASFSTCLIDAGQTFGINAASPRRRDPFGTERQPHLGQSDERLCRGEPGPGQVPHLRRAGLPAGV